MTTKPTPKPMPYPGHARGVVVALESPTPDWTLATIQWNKGEFPDRVNVANLAIVGANSRFCAI